MQFISKQHKKNKIRKEIYDAIQNKIGGIDEPRSAVTINSPDWFLTTIQTTKTLILGGLLK
jgi:hypothetical protein